jgi:hypothetical protein
VKTLTVQRSFYGDRSIVPFDFDGPFGGGIAVEPQYGGCGGSEYQYGIYTSTTGAQRVVLFVDLPDASVLAARDDAYPFVGTGTPGATDGAQFVAQFRDPGAVALSWDFTSRRPNDAVYVADTGNHTIRKITFRISFENCPQPYFVSTLAGVAGQPGSADGDATTARFHSPRGLAAAPDGSLYVADSGNHTIRRIAPDGRVTTVAGEAGVAGSNDGIGSAAHLNTPSGLAVDAAGNVYIADTGNHTIRRLSPNGLLETIAGTPGVAGFTDGDALSAQFRGPVGLTLLGDSLYVADTSNNAIRRYYVPAEPNGRRRAAR